MRCPNCGQENRTGARFCSQCRAALSGPGDQALRPGQTMNDGQYRILRQLGKGGMGAIYLAANTQAFDRSCVIKEMLAYYEAGEEQEARERFEREAKTLAALKHPGIPDMYGYFSEGGHNYIVMEYIEGANLKEGLSHEDGQGRPVKGQPQPVGEVLRYGIEICRVLEYLANITPEPFVHNDIKPANIIIDRNSDQAVLVDFGTAKVRYALDSGGQVGVRQSDVYGTVGYAPPEQYQGRSEPKSDVYALAATMYHLLTDDDPRDHPFKFPRLADVPAGLRRVLEKTLATDVNKRLSAAEFRRQLEAVRAARSGTLQPLSFPQGEIATTVTGVLDLSIKYWDYARRILYDGSLDAWLRNSLYNPIVADQAKEATRHYPKDPDAGLDSFLRALNPRLPKPQVRVIDHELEFGDLELGESTKVLLSIVNTGPAGAHGEIEVSTGWLRPAVHDFGLGPHDREDLEIYVTNTGGLAPGQRYRGIVTLRPAGGVPVSVEVCGRIVPASATGQLPKTPISTQPQSAPKPRAGVEPAPRHKGASKGGVLAVLLVIVLVAAAGYFLVGRGLVVSGDYAKGLEALQAGEWQQAQRILSKLDPASDEAVAAVGRALDRQMVDVPPGTLVMGRNDINAQPDQKPAHGVKMLGYRMGRYEVTNAQYQRFVNETGHEPPGHWHNGHYPAGEALRPVVNVMWEDARAYCQWLSQELKGSIRLPTEVEWEWAARGEAGFIYPWGNEDEKGCRNAADGRDEAMDVGSYPCGESAFGLMDMAGNVREWTADVYDLYKDPHDPPPTGRARVIRGGSWDRYDVASTAREHAEPTAKAEDLGFRFVWVAP